MASTARSATAPSRASTDTGAGERTYRRREHLGGRAFSCARSTSRGVVCWGFDALGHGDGTTTDRSVPVSILGPVGATGLGPPRRASAAARARCATARSRCIAGARTSGQLGNGTTASMGLTVPTQTAIIDAVEVVTGGSESCARVRSNQISCWSSAGQLGGAGTLDRYATPMIVLLGTSDVAQIALGMAFICMRRTGGAVACWGSNVDGQIGDGTTINRRIPRDVVGLTDAVDVAGQRLRVRPPGRPVRWSAGGATTAANSTAPPPIARDSCTPSASRSAHCTIGIELVPALCPVSTGDWNTSAAKPPPPCRRPWRRP